MSRDVRVAKEQHHLHTECCAAGRQSSAMVRCCRCRCEIARSQPPCFSRRGTSGVMSMRTTGVRCDVEPSDAFYHWGGLLGLIAFLERGELRSPKERL